MAVPSIRLVSLFMTYKHHGVILTKKKKTHHNERDLLNECKNKLVLRFV